VAGRQSGGDHQWSDVAAIPGPMPRATEKRRGDAIAGPSPDDAHRPGPAANTDRRAPAPAPAPSNYAATPTPMSAGEFASEQQARARCPRIRWCGSTFSRTSITSPAQALTGPAITGARKKGHTYARRMHRPPAIVRRWMSGIRSERLASSKKEPRAGGGSDAGLTAHWPAGAYRG